MKIKWKHYQDDRGSLDRFKLYLDDRDDTSDVMETTLRRLGRSKAILECNRLSQNSLLFLGYKMAAAYQSTGFIKEVQKYENLYNKFSRDYKDRFMRVNCFKEIGEKFQMDAAEAEKKYKNIRISNRCFRCFFRCLLRRKNKKKNRHAALSILAVRHFVLRLPQKIMLLDTGSTKAVTSRRPRRSCGI